MRLVAYLRVSTDRQAEDGLGLEIQEQRIREWAKNNGHVIALVCKDEGVSGTHGLDQRDGLGAVLEALRGAVAQGVVVYRLDRLARDLVVQEQLLAELWRMGAAVFSTSESESSYLKDDPEDPSRKLIRQVLGAVSEYERAMISLRLRAGRKRKAENGGFAGGGLPFGYRSDGDTLVEDEQETATLCRIRTLKESGLSLRGIAATLESEGLSPRRGSRWHPGTLAPIVRRLDYCGPQRTAL